MQKVNEPNAADAAERLRQLLPPDKFPQHTVAHFPHIVVRLAENWGTRECPKYLQSLIVTDRPGRQGFPNEVALELFVLGNLHDTLYPALDAARGGAGDAVDCWGERETR